jgi:hypothetical protein
VVEDEEITGRRRVNNGLPLSFVHHASSNCLQFPFGDCQGAGKRKQTIELIVRHTSAHKGEAK